MPASDMHRLRFISKRNRNLFFDIHVPDKQSALCILEHFKDDPTFNVDLTRGLTLFTAVSDAIAHIETQRKDA